ncbi:MAG TPA: UPF0158 family protein [Candidatus Saccharimonadales bacterium]|nr:UPF0158 family protein [Candidatus Saccharimonadales bacterium]
MAIVISLRDVIDALEMARDDASIYLDPDTGEIIIVTDDDQRHIEEEASDDHLPEWQRELMPAMRAALENDRLLPLPDRFDVHDWAIMERFAREQKNERIQQELLDSIHKSGAFRKFRSTVQRLGILDAWYTFRNQALEKIAREWLEEHHLPYK